MKRNYSRGAVFPEDSGKARPEAAHRRRTSNADWLGRLTEVYSFKKLRAGLRGHRILR